MFQKNGVNFPATGKKASARATLHEPPPLDQHLHGAYVLLYGGRVAKTRWWLVSVGQVESDEEGPFQAAALGLDENSLSNPFFSPARRSVQPNIPAVGNAECQVNPNACISCAFSMLFDLERRPRA